MARPLRIEFSGALYHVMSRGNERGDIVRDASDRQKRLDWLRRTVKTYGWRLHAFVLNQYNRGNHANHVLQRPGIPASGIRQTSRIRQEFQQLDFDRLIPFYVFLRRLARAEWHRTFGSESGALRILRLAGENPYGPTV